MSGNKKHATCFATLLQNELQSNVARFATLNKYFLHQNRLFTILVPRARRFLVTWQGNEGATGRLQIKPSGSGDENGC